MTYKVVITESAYQDVDDILAYIVVRAGNVAPARSFLDRWSSMVEALSRFPEMHPLNHLSELSRLGYRSFVTGKYVTLYRYDDKDVYIVHVFYGSRDYARFVMQGENNSGR